MKTNYETPRVEVIGIEIEAAVLASSTVPADPNEVSGSPSPIGEGDKLY